MSKMFKDWQDFFKQNENKGVLIQRDTDHGILNQVLTFEEIYQIFQERLFTEFNAEINKIKKGKL